MNITKGRIRQIIKEELEALNESETDGYEWSSSFDQAMGDIERIYGDIENEAQATLFMEELPKRVDEMIKAWKGDRGAVQPYHR